MDALYLVLSENGISTPSKKTRKTIIKASDKISAVLQKDLKKRDSQENMGRLEMERLPAILRRIEEEVSA